MTAIKQHVEWLQVVMVGHGWASADVARETPQTGQPAAPSRQGCKRSSSAREALAEKQQFAAASAPDPAAKKQSRRQRTRASRNNTDKQRCTLNDARPHVPPAQIGETPSSAGLRAVPFSRLCPCGFVLVWARKAEIAQAVHHLCDACGFVYVENLTWVLLHEGNAAPARADDVCACSHLTLLIFRRPGVAPRPCCVTVLPGCGPSVLIHGPCSVVLLSVLGVPHVCMALTETGRPGQVQTRLAPCRAPD